MSNPPSDAVPMLLVTTPHPHQFTITPTTQTQPFSTPLTHRRIPQAANSAPHIPHAELHAEDCICTICVCGKHRCPPTPHTTSSSPSSHFSSESRSSYTGTFAPAIRVTPSRSSLPPQRSFDATSHYRDDYPWYDVTPTRSCAPHHYHQNADDGAHLPFHASSEMKQAYPQHELPKRETHKPRTLNADLPEDRDFTSEHRQAYSPKSVPVRSSGTSSPTLSNTSPNLPFTGRSTHASDYPKYGSTGRPSLMHPRDQLRRVELPDDRDFASEHRAQFTPKETERCPAEAVAVKTKQKSGHILVERVGPASFRRK